MNLRRLTVIRDILYEEVSLPDSSRVTRVAACAVILNPCASTAAEDLTALEELGEKLGSLLIEAALVQLPRTAISYGKSAVVGVNGEIEHAAAILHPRMGRPMRNAVGGGKAVIPSTQKIAHAGAAIDVPLAHKDDAWSFDHIDTITVMVEGAPRPDELLVIVALSDGGRPRPRVGNNGTLR